LEPVARRLNLFQAIGDGLASLATALNPTGGANCQPIIHLEAMPFHDAPGSYPLVVNG